MHARSEKEYYKEFPLHLPIYIIDPPGCEDADDGFSFDLKSNMLYIHIADPTYHINNDKSGLILLQKLSRQLQTFYPYNERPIHLLPERMRQLSTLNRNFDTYKEDNHMISLLFSVDIKQHVEFKSIECYKFSKSHVVHSMTYDEASKRKDQVLNRCLDIVRHNYDKSIPTKSFSNLPSAISTQTFDSSGHYISCAKETLKMKAMIEYFAVLANKSIGKRYPFILRACNHESGTYQSESSHKSSYHSKLKTKSYSHFTSPLRRLLDLIMHLFIKNMIFKENYDYLFQSIVYSSNELNVSNLCERVNRLNKTHKWLSAMMSKVMMMHYINDSIGKHRIFDVIFKYKSIQNVKMQFLLLESINTKQISIKFDMFYVCLLPERQEEIGKKHKKEVRLQRVHMI